jgi:hypothetical protein
MHERTVRLLQESKARVERGWTQVVMARDAAGGLVAAWSEHAVCWCALGALRAGSLDSSVAEMFLSRALPAEAMRENVAAWQDEPGRQKEEVVALFDRAIEIAVAECAP